MTAAPKMTMTPWSLKLTMTTLMALPMPRLFGLRFYMSCSICDFKHDLVELVGTFLKPRHEREADGTRQVSAQRAAEMVRLLFVGLDSTEPPEQPDAGEVLATAGDTNAAQQDEPVMSAAGSVDRRHMRMMIQTFFDPDLVDVDDEDKDTPGDRNFAGNFTAATDFVNRLWDVRRIVAVCRDVDLDISVRKMNTMQQCSVQLSPRASNHGDTQTPAAATRAVASAAATAYCCGRRMWCGRSSWLAGRARRESSGNPGQRRGLPAGSNFRYKTGAKALVGQFASASAPGPYYNLVFHLPPTTVV
ncbi:hypothetical protein GUJ93_ZPchr0006g43949 [Zizania palustris]|uniref:Uncharacterized protein n=1 Tax=Zizania palustris TaxID=103762 RepID=A0A8J5VT52_ZIZPA|nr:hypothetical protein GUJ93_ZPchr0006g43949 [Zizania palustris]